MTDDVNEMESILGRYRPAGAGATLRGRIVRRGARRSRWVFWEAMAAMLLIGMNLAQIGASLTQLISPPQVEPARTQEIAAAIRGLDLAVSAEEARAMADQLAAGNRLVLLPVLHGPARTSFDYGALP